MKYNVGDVVIYDDDNVGEIVSIVNLHLPYNVVNESEWVNKTDIRKIFHKNFPPPPFTIQDLVITVDKSIVTAIFISRKIAEVLCDNKSSKEYKIEDLKLIKKIDINLKAMINEL